MIDVEKAIGAAVKTGKVSFGANLAIKSAKSGRAKLILLASNSPRELVDDINYYTKLSNIPVVIYKGSSIDLGMVCGKPFMVSALTVREVGDSDIMGLVERATESSEETETSATEEADA